MFHATNSGYGIKTMERRRNKCFLLKCRCFKEFELTHIFLTVYPLNKNKNWRAFLLPPKMLKSLESLWIFEWYIHFNFNFCKTRRMQSHTLYLYYFFYITNFRIRVHFWYIFSCLKVAIQWNLSPLSITTMSLITQYIACYLANAFITGNSQKVLMST